MRLLPVLLTSLAMLACGGEAAEPLPPEAADEAGPFAVGHTTFVAVDAARAGRSLPVDVWYPVDPADAVGGEPARYPLLGALGIRSEAAREDAPASAAERHPLLVFSHGYGGIRVQSFELMGALASHGFVVASPEHTGNSQATPGDDYDTAAGNRVPDVSFVIDTLLARAEDAADALYGAVDGAAIGVLGHSFGGSTAIGAAVGWAGAEADPRVGAILPISAVVDGGERPSSNAGFSPERRAASR